MRALCPFYSLNKIKKKVTHNKKRKFKPVKVLQVKFDHTPLFFSPTDIGKKLLILFTGGAYEFFSRKKKLESMVNNKIKIFDGFNFLFFLQYKKKIYK